MTTRSGWLAIMGLAAAMGLPCLALAQGAPPSASPDAAPPSAARPGAIELAAVDPVFVQPILLDRTDRMTLPVHIGGQGPFGFVVDTGAERSVVSNEIAGRLGLSTAGRARVVGIAETVTADMFHLRDLRLRDVPLGDLVVPAFSQGNIGGPGLIGIDSLENHRLLIDFVAGRMDIRPSTRARRPQRDPEIDDDDAIVVVARRLAGRMILSNAELNGRRIDVIVDTGAQSSIGNLALQRLVRREGLRGGGGGAGQITGVTGATLEVRVGQIQRLKVGGVDFTNLPVAYADSPAFTALGLDRRPALLLGMDALRLFDRVSIDFANRRVVFDLPDGAHNDAGRRYARQDGQDSQDVTPPGR
jgi:predicted aspartyl protease